MIYGRRGGYDVPIDLASLSATDGFRIDGAATDDFSGGSVSFSGDVNNDGIADMIIGAWGADPNGRVTMRVQVT